LLSGYQGYNDIPGQPLILERRLEIIKMRHVFSLNLIALAALFCLTAPTRNIQGADVKKAPKRSEIEQRYKWRLEDIYATDSQWEKDFAQVKETIPRIEAFKGRLGESSAELLSLFRLQDTVGVTLGKLYVYSHMRRDEDTGNTQFQALADRSESLNTSYSAAGSFVVPEILLIPEERLRGWIEKDPGLQLYRHRLEDILRTKAHTLSQEEEKLLALSAEATRTPATVFSMLDNADLRYPSIKDEKGEEVELTKARYSRFIESGDRELRKRAFEAFFETYNKYQNTLAALLGGIVKRDIFYARARKYDTSLSAALDGDNIPAGVYDNVITSVNDNLAPMHRYISLRKKLMKIEAVHPYDLYNPLFPEVNAEYSYEKARELVDAALKPLGEQYMSVLNKGFDSGWIDVYESQGKRSGGYSWGSYGTHPYILLNYNGTLHEVFTVAHEMGHAMHSYFTWNTQPPVYGDYTIFVAEVASTTNECLLMDRLLKVTTDRQQELSLLDHYVRQIQGTVYIQALFAEFEREIHTRSEAEQPLTGESLNALCRSLYQKYFGPDMAVDEIYEINWGRIPHFYSDFYVYQYVTGYSAGALLSEKVLKGEPQAREKYLDFLKSGSSDYSIDLLRRAGVDMTSPEPIVACASLMNRLLDRMELLLAQ
jgi:oligoendopeptidase F